MDSDGTDDVDIQSYPSPQADVCGRCLVVANIFEDGLHDNGQRTSAIPYNHLLSEEEHSQRHHLGSVQERCTGSAVYTNRRPLGTEERVYSEAVKRTTVPDKNRIS